MVYCYAYYVSKIYGNYILPLEIVSEMVLPCILIIIYWAFTTLFAFRLKNGLNLNILKDSIVIFTSDDILDIYFLNKKEIDEIKEYFSQRINLKI